MVSWTASNRTEMTTTVNTGYIVPLQRLYKMVQRDLDQIAAGKAEVMTDAHMRRSCFVAQRDGMVVTMDLE